MSTTDGDSNDTHTYSFCGGVNDSNFAISGTSLKTNAVFDYETKSLYSICVRTTDSANDTFDKNISLSITNVNDAPIFTTNLTNLSILEDNGTLSFELNATDADANNLTITVKSNNTNLLTISSSWDMNTTVDQTTYNSSLDFNISTVSNANGVATITIIVSDGELNSTSTYNINVTVVNDAPILTQPNDLNLSEDFADFNITLNGTDIDSSNLTYNALSRDTGKVITSINGNILTLYSVQDANGIVTIDVNVTDGDLSDTKSFDINITSVDDAPVLATIPNPSAQDEDFSDFNITLSSTDLENDSVIYNAKSNDTSKATVTLNGNILTIHSVTNAIGEASIDVNVTQENNSSLYDFQTLTFTVNPVNDAPVLTQPSNITKTEDFNDFNITLAAVDVDDMNLIYSASSNDTSKATLSLNENILTIHSVNNAVGLVRIDVNVTDGNLSDIKSFDINITNINDIPTLAPISDITLNEDFNLFNILVTPSDIDLDNLKLTVDMNASGIISIPTNSTDWINEGNYSLGLNLPISAIANKSGSVELNVTVQDPSGAKANQIFTITVNPQDDAPIASSMAATVGPNSVNTFDKFTPNFSDIDGDMPNTLRIETLPTVGTFETNTTSEDGNWTTITSAPFEVSMSDLGKYRFNAGNNAGLTTDVNWSIMTSYDNTYSHGLWSNIANGVVTIIDPANNNAPEVNITDNNGNDINGSIITIDEDTKTQPVYITFSDDYTQSKFLVGVIDSNDTSKVSLNDGDFNITRISDNNVSVIITPKANTYGDVNITLGAFDGDKNGTKSFTLRIASVNDIPTAMNFEKTIDEDNNYSFSELNPTTVYSDINDSTQNQNEQYPDIFQIVTLPQHGSLHLGDNQPLIADTNVSINNLSSLVYTPQENNNTDVTFTWRAFDGEEWTEIKTATIYINAIDDAPVLETLNSQTISEDTSELNITLLSSDVENNQITYSASSSNNPEFCNRKIII